MHNMRYARLCSIVSVIWVLLIACSEGVTEAPSDSASSSSESADQKKVAITTNEHIYMLEFLMRLWTPV